MRLLLTSFSLIVSLNLIGQIGFYDEETDEEYNLDPNSDQEIIARFLKVFEAQELRFNPDQSSMALIQMKDKKGKWRLYDDYVEPINEIGYDSISWPIYGWDGEYVYFENGGKKDLFWDLGIFKFKKKAIYDEIEKEPDSEIIFARKGDKWGQIIVTGQMMQPFIFDSKSEVPILTDFGWGYDYFEEFRKEYKIDIIKVVNDYSLLGRHGKTGKWGYYEGEGGFYDRIPAKYDKIEFLDEIITLVYDNEKMGWYSEMELMEDAIYDEIKVLDDRAEVIIAARQNDQWQLFSVWAEKLLEGEKGDLNVLLKKLDQ